MDGGGLLKDPPNPNSTEIKNVLTWMTELLDTLPTPAKILQSSHSRVTVLPNSKYTKKYPGTGGVTLDTNIYFPVNSITAANPGILLHESTHAAIDAVSTESPLSLPTASRIEYLRNLFQKLGLNPDDGEQVAISIGGWENVQTKLWPDYLEWTHVVTSLMGAAEQREMAGDAPLSPESQENLINRIALRELALVLNSTNKGLLVFSDEKLLETWSKTAQGSLYGLPPGKTIAQQADALRSLLVAAENDDFTGAQPAYPS